MPHNKMKIFIFFQLRNVVYMPVVGVFDAYFKKSMLKLYRFYRVKNIKTRKN